jgi:hypothetical protein
MTGSGFSAHVALGACRGNTMRFLRLNLRRDRTDRAGRRTGQVDRRTDDTAFPPECERRLGPDDRRRERRRHRA